MHVPPLFHPSIRQKVLFCLLFLPLLGHAQWTPLNTGTIEILSEIVFPSSDTGYVSGANGTLLRTFNAGENWTLLDIGSTEDVNDLYFLNHLTGFLVGNEGLFAITHDAGEHWNTEYLSTNQSLDLSTVWFTTELTGYVGGRTHNNEGIILKTIDGGITWDETEAPFSLFDINYKKIVFPTPDIGYALTRGMCMKTVDGGDHWFITDTALVASGNMFSLLEDAYFVSADTGYIVGWYSGFSGYTVNGGMEWTDQMISNNQWYSIDFPSRQIGYLSGWGQLMKTIDGGKTWTNETSTHIESNSIYSIDFTNDDTGYACGTKGVILKTTNGGITQTRDISHSSELKVYPNPTSGSFHFSTDNLLSMNTNKLTFQIYTMQGKKVMEVFDHELPSYVDISMFLPGMYFLKASTSIHQFVTKIIVK